MRNPSPTNINLHVVDVRRFPTGLLIAELADLEDKIRLLKLDDSCEDFQPVMQDLVEAEYTILRELRRRQPTAQRGIRWPTLRPRRNRTVLSQPFGPPLGPE